MIVNEIICERALSRTSINLADRVINPYRGCFLGCRYCYASSLKHAKKSGLEWGSYVDAKINIAEVLKHELASEKEVSKILIGSTTEIYQPIEFKLRLTRKILEVIQKFNKEVIILTKSPLIKIDCDILKTMRHQIFFTCTPPLVYKFLEPRGASFEERLEVVGHLVDSGLNVIPYVCPLFPEMFDLEKFFISFKNIGIKNVQFENVNLKTLKIEDLGNLDLWAKEIYSDEQKYSDYWQNISFDIDNLSREYGIGTKFFLHKYDNYCKINYNLI